MSFQFCNSRFGDLIDLPHDLGKTVLALVDGHVDDVHRLAKFVLQALHVALEVARADLGADLCVELDLLLAGDDTALDDSLHLVGGAGGWAALAVLDVTELDLAVDRLQVHLLDLLAPQLGDGAEDLAVVELKAVLLQLLVDGRVLGEDSAVHVGLGECEAADLLDGHVDELALLVVDDVVVADDLLARLPLAEGELVAHAVRDEAEGDLDLALEDEVHLRDLVLLVVDDLVLVGGLELARHEAKDEVVDELLLVLCLHVEEALVGRLLEYVLVEVDDDNLILDLAR